MNNDYKYKLLEKHDIDNFLSWFDKLHDKMSISYYMIKRILQEDVRKDENNNLIYVNSGYFKDKIISLLDSYNKKNNNISSTSENIRKNIEDRRYLENKREIRRKEIEDNRILQQKKEKMNILKKNKYIDESRMLDKEIKELEKSINLNKRENNFDDSVKIENLAKMEESIDNLKNLLILKNKNLTNKQKIFLKMNNMIKKLN